MEVAAPARPVRDHIEAAEPNDRALVGVLSGPGSLTSGIWRGVVWRRAGAGVRGEVRRGTLLGGCLVVREVEEEVEVKALRLGGMVSVWWIVDVGLELRLEWDTLVLLMERYSSLAILRSDRDYEKQKENLRNSESSSTQAFLSRRPRWSSLSLDDRRLRYF